MPFAISNILWPAELDEQALLLARKCGADGIEVAPTRIAPWSELTANAARCYRKQLEDIGLKIPSMQAILFGRQDATLLSDKESYQRFVEHILFVADHAVELGAKRMVFGAPKNRLRNTLSSNDAMQLASERLRPVSEHLHARGVALVIEPVPASYGCDFINKAAEAAKLVRMIDHPGIRLHLDTGALIVSRESAKDIVAEHHDILAHVHVSRPELAAVTDVLPIDNELAGALTQANYQGWVSIEISTKENALTCIERALTVTRMAYKAFSHAA
ncbi:MAG: sugar phosphate isomerase/epimerase family protein [Alphaproteobacteria bacterium]